jgi:hypothetical protein
MRYQDRGGGMSVKQPPFELSYVDARADCMIRDQCAQENRRSEESEAWTEEK